MATLNEHTSVLAAISSDISDHSDMNFIYILSVKNELQKEHFKTNRHAKRKHNLFTNKHTSHVTKAAGIEVFYDPKKMRALSREQIV